MTSTDSGRPLTDAQINAARGILEIDERLGRESDPDIVAAAARKTTWERRGSRAS